MLTKLQRPDLRAFFTTIASRHLDVEPLFEAVDLFVLLHRADLAAVPLRFLMAAVDTAIQTPEVFKPELLLASIRRMEGARPLPKMFMRSVIQVLKSNTKLRGEISALLSRLAARQVSG